VWFDWGTRLLAILALLTIVAGLLVLSLPEMMEGQEIISLNKTHSLRVADLLGAALVGLGAVVAWATVLAWQRKRIEQ
jgi:drug/metabolite transporter (DMT)-like permease